MPSRREDEALEQYLARLDRFLSKLPANERADALREVRQHLELLAENERTAGDKEAIQAAIERFGSAKQLARMFYYERFINLCRRRLPRILMQSLVVICALFPSLGRSLFGLSGPLSVSIASVLGAVLGVIGGWKWAQGRKRLWAEDAAAGLPKKPARYSSGIRIFCIALLVALIIEIRLPDGNSVKWGLAMWTAFLLTEITIAPLTQRILLRRDMRVDTGRSE